MSDDEEIRLPIMEESLSVDNERVSDGRVRVTTETEVVTELANLEVSSETVRGTRVAMETQVHGIPQVRTEENITIIPVLEERFTRYHEAQCMADVLNDVGRESRRTGANQSR